MSTTETAAPAGPTVLGTSLPVAVRRSSGGDYYEFGVMWGGAFITLVARKTGGVDKWRGIAAAQQQAAQQPPAPSPADTADRSQQLPPEQQQPPAQ